MVSNEGHDALLGILEFVDPVFVVDRVALFVHVVPVDVHEGLELICVEPHDDVVRVQFEDFEELLGHRSVELLRLVEGQLHELLVLSGPHLGNVEFLDHAAECGDLQLVQLDLGGRGCADVFALEIVFECSLVHEAHVRRALAVQVREPEFVGLVVPLFGLVFGFVSYLMFGRLFLFFVGVIVVRVGVVVARVLVLDLRLHRLPGLDETVFDLGLHVVEQRVENDVERGPLDHERFDLPAFGNADVLLHVDEELD